MTLIPVSVFRGEVQTEDFKLEEIKDALDEHLLMPLWTFAKKLIEANYPKDERYKLIELTIQEFNKADKNGQMTRYEHDKNTHRRRVYGRKLPVQIGLNTLRQRIDVVYERLSYYEGGIMDWLDQGL